MVHVDTADLKTPPVAARPEAGANPGGPPDAPPRGPSRLRRLAVTTFIALGALTSVASLVMLASTAQDARLFDRLQAGLLVVNLASVLVLTVMIGRKLHELVRDWRANVPGSRMKARAVLVFSVLALAPVALPAQVAAKSPQRDV